MEKVNSIIIIIPLEEDILSSELSVHVKLTTDIRGSDIFFFT